jgi:hypothetical protein
MSSKFKIYRVKSTDKGFDSQNHDDVELDKIKKTA